MNNRTHFLCLLVGFWSILKVISYQRVKAFDPFPPHQGQESVITNSIINTSAFSCDVVQFPSVLFLGLWRWPGQATHKKWKVPKWGHLRFFFSVSLSRSLIHSNCLSVLAARALYLPLSLFTFLLRATVISSESHGLKIRGYWSVRHSDE